MNRRHFCATSIAGSLISAIRASAKDQKKPRILLRSSWQTINIGDIAHSPGLLAILEKHLPEAEVTLWASYVDRGVKEMLLRRFPGLKITTAGGNRKTWNRIGEIHELFKEIDFFLHGSGPWLVSPRSVEEWIKQTGKPFGVYGISLPEERADERIVSLLSQSQFTFFRDSMSLEVARSKGVNCPVMEFGPDGAFGFDILNEKKAHQFLKDNQLENKKFLCMIPRYRKTPEWELPGREKPESEWKHLHLRNQEMAEKDLKPYREAITSLIRQTSMKVLICPEDMTQIKLGKKFVYDRLPKDVQKRVVWKSEYWLTDEALSTYLQSAGLFGLEQHSPIMCIGNGIPALLGRFREQTTKGFMWKDIGLSDWYFDSDSKFDMDRLTAAVLELANDPQGCIERAKKAQNYVNSLNQKCVGTLEENFY